MTENAMSSELSAMVSLESALTPLSPEERGRVLAWAASRFELPIPAAPAKPGSRKETPSDPSTPDNLAEFYDAAGPTTDADKCLVVGYWFQYREGAAELDANTLNTQLKHLGHGIGNITRALEWHKSQKPALMVQKRKEGTTQQAKKKFAVTNEGKKYVEKMLAKVIE